jgi:hypothetical protein
MDGVHRGAQTALIGFILAMRSDLGFQHHRRPALDGHLLSPGRSVLVGHQACLGYGSGHTTWTCRTCDATVYGPPMNTHCTALDGPATVRISNAT